MVCASFTEAQKQKIINRKRYVKKDKAGVSDVSKDESELLGEPDRVIFFKDPSKSLNRQLIVFIIPHQNPAMLCWEIPELRCWDWITYLNELPSMCPRPQVLFYNGG